MMRRRSVSITSVALMALVGCQEPSQIVPAGPPGVELQRIPVEPEGEGPAALGESVAQAKALSAKANSNTAPAVPTKVGETVTTASGLKYTTLAEGTGETCEPGQSITIKYVGKLATNDLEFDRSGNNPATFRVGTGNLIPGWDEGVPGMKVGEKRRLEIPAALGYGKNPPPNSKIPANSDLVFEIELLGVSK